MKIVSSVFTNNSSIPKKYTCDGKNINPPLSFFDMPPNAKSFALIVDDPDAPGGTWTHWVLYNIDPHVREISENSVPSGATEGITSFGKTGYGGPCPPFGTHRYFFKLYALNDILSFKQRVRKEEVEKEINRQLIDSTQIVGLYKR